MNSSQAQVQERILRHLNQVVLEEDMTVLRRREALFGDFIEDFLRPRQVILFKELFREHYSQTSQQSRAVALSRPPQES